MDIQSIKEQVISGLALAAKVLFGFATIGMFWGGIIAITDPEHVRPDSFLFHPMGVGTHSFIAGWLCLAISTAILILTMDGWVKILSGWFAYSTLGGLIMLSGQYSGRPVPRSAALFVTLFAILTALVTWTLRERKLYVIDRVALMGFQTCVALGLTPNLPRMFKALSTGFAFLLLAWVANWVRDHRDRQSSHRLPSRTADGRR